MAELRLKDGMVHNTHSYIGAVQVDTNDRAMVVGPVTFSGTVTCNGSLTVLNEVNITGTLNVNTGGSFDVR
tara:strand:+ start:631 stop:843 length:213 start_codon:yes stop_codon:yes gene_type:complete